MKENKLYIAVIGAGETGTPLLEKLITAPFIKILGVSDLDENAPGMVLARQAHIPTFTNYMDVVKQDAKIDIIMDVTGSHSVRDQLRHYMQESENHHTVIMHEMIAVLLMSLAHGKLVPFKHHDAVDYD